MEEVLQEFKPKQKFQGRENPTHNPKKNLV